MRSLSSSFFHQFQPIDYLTNKKWLCNVRSIKKDTKCSSNTLLRLVSFFMVRTLVLIGVQIFLESESVNEMAKDQEYFLSNQNPCGRKFKAIKV